MRRRQALVEADQKRILAAVPPPPIQEEVRHGCHYCTRDFGSNTALMIHISRMHKTEWNKHER